MPRSKRDKTTLLSDLADHVLAHGLNTASLRPMAAAAGTSDRMLIYYFETKDGLISELLDHLAAQMAHRLDHAIPPRRYASEAQLLTDIVALMRSDSFAPYIRVWLDIISSAAQGSEAHRAAGHGIINLYLEWLAKRHPKGAEGAALALTVIEGTLIMDALGHKVVTDAACSDIRA